MRNYRIIGVLFLFLALYLVLPSVSIGSFFSCNEINYFSDGCPEKTEKKTPGESMTDTIAPDDQRDSQSSKYVSSLSTNKSLLHSRIGNSLGGKDEVTQEDIDEYIRLFGNPTVSSNGEVNYKLPSMPVLKYTVHPTKENALEVARWYKERTERVLTMMKTVKEVTAENEYPEIQIADLKKVVFYFSPTCPYSKAMVAQLNKISQYAQVKGYTDTKNIEALMAFNTALRPSFKIYRVNHNVFVDNSITSVPTIIWLTKNKGGFKTVGYKQYVKDDGTVDLKHQLSGNRKRSSCK